MAEDRLAMAFDGVRKLIVEAAAEKAFNKLTRDEKRAIKIGYSSVAAWFMETHELKFRDDPSK